MLNAKQLFKGNKSPITIIRLHNEYMKYFSLYIYFTLKISCLRIMILEI